MITKKFTPLSCGRDKVCMLTIAHNHLITRAIS